MYLLTAVLRMTVLAQKHCVQHVCLRQTCPWLTPESCDCLPWLQDSQQFGGNILKSCGSLECFHWDFCFFLSSLDMAHQDVNTWKRQGIDYFPGAFRGGVSRRQRNCGPVDADFGPQVYKTIEQ